jgi:hypothetical protein
LSIQAILKWADRFQHRTGNWPTSTGGPIPESRGETWVTVDRALKRGVRGLPKSSLFKLLAKHRGVYRHRRRPKLSLAQIGKWADEHHRRTTKWPQRTDARLIPGSGGETWWRINAALEGGKRGLPGNMTLAQFLHRHRGVRTRVALADLSERTILKWAREFRRHHRRWPTRYSGPIAHSGGETWQSVNHALRLGRRGLKHRTSLFRLLGKGADRSECTRTY